MFFQAEDGIRDIGVTGVQTCALPILGEAAAADRRPVPRRAGRGGRRPAGPGAAVAGPAARGVDRPGPAAVSVVCRSEELGVGVEGRSRWSVYHSKNTFSFTKYTPLFF